MASVRLLLDQALGSFLTLLLHDPSGLSRAVQSLVLCLFDLYVKGCYFESWENKRVIPDHVFVLHLEENCPMPVSPALRKKLAQLLERKASAVEGISQEHRSYFFRKKKDDLQLISQERMLEMIDECFI